MRRLRQVERNVLRQIFRGRNLFPFSGVSLFNEGNAPVWQNARLGGQHPAKALMILLTLWAAALAVRAKLTEHARFNRTFVDAVWDLVAGSGRERSQWNGTRRISLVSI